MGYSWYVLCRKEVKGIGTNRNKIGPGWIASVFSKDLVIDPKTRKVEDIVHVVQAAASATSIDRAKQFLVDVDAPSGTAYGSYEELVNDPNVDIIYIATPHSHHFPHCLLALNAGKPVVCEKPFTVNAEQTKILVNLARAKKLFLMEAVWTRFFPLSIEVRQLIKDKKIGDVKRVFADLSLCQDPETKYDDSHRMVNPDLAGGVLLDRKLSTPVSSLYEQQLTLDLQLAFTL